MHGKVALFYEPGIPVQGRRAETHGAGKGLVGDNAAQGKEMVIGPAAIKDYLDHKGIE